MLQERKCDADEIRDTTNNTLDLFESDRIDNHPTNLCSGELRSSDKGAGIVCSDEDLRSILSDVSHTRRLSADVKREKMKSNRSLSLDSSFFKMHMKRLQAESPGWLSRILSQRDRSDIEACCKCPEDKGDVLQADGITKKNMSKKSGASSNTISEDHSTTDCDLTSRRSSINTESDDEFSLLLVENPEMIDGNSNPSISEVEMPVNTIPLASTVMWDSSSVVDVEILGNAIEFYLTSVGKRIPVNNSNQCQNRGSDFISNDVHSSKPGENVAGPIISSLKSLFV